MLDPAMPDPAAEIGLLELNTLVRDCTVSGVARRVLLLRTDLLPPDLLRPHCLRLLDEALAPLETADRARRHALPSGRVAISWRGDAAERLRDVTDRFALLLDGKPAIRLPLLVRPFELPQDGAVLLALASRQPTDDTAPDDAPPTAPTPTPGPTLTLPPKPRPAPRPPLDLAGLETVERSLARAAIGPFLRHRLVCRTTGTGVTPAWEQRYVSVPAILAEAAPAADLHTAPWLARRLTRLLDRRLLATLARPGELLGSRPFALELNVSGVLSPEFSRFDAALPTALRGHTILALHVADAMSDLPAFRFAAGFARARAYQVLLRGLTPPMLALLDLPALAPDYAELRWSPPVLALPPETLPRDAPPFILAHADDTDALVWGRAAGISLFSGSAIRPAGQGPRPQAT